MVGLICCHDVNISIGQLFFTKRLSTSCAARPLDVEPGRNARAGARVGGCHPQLGKLAWHVLPSYHLRPQCGDARHARRLLLASEHGHSKMLQNEMKSLLDGITVLDMSSTRLLPETSSAAYQALTVSALNAACSCRKDDKVASLIMRSASNTPSFLFGTHWGMLPMIQSHSKHKTDELMEQQRTPAAYVFFWKSANML